MKRDLEKFREHYPERAFTFWNDWVQKLDELVTLPDEWEWPLDVIQAAEKIKPSATGQSVPETLQALQDKEMQPTRQVNQILFIIQ